MQISFRSSGSLFTFDRHLIISALMFGFNGNSLKYFFLYLYFIGTKEWVRKNLRYTPDQRALLVWDSFRRHLTDGVKELLARRNVDVAVIPGGLTPVLQPLDKCLNKPFKTRVRAQYQAWMVNGPFTYTPSRKKRAPNKELVLQWVNKAWQEIPAELVIRSFKSCGISNALDGTEDEAVYEEESESGDVLDADDELDNEFDTDSESEDE